LGYFEKRCLRLNNIEIKTLNYLNLVVILLFATLSYAQEKNEFGIITGEGVLYKSDGDTLKGIINYPTLDFRKVFFQKTRDEEKIKFKIPSFTAFTIGTDSFVVKYDFKIQSNEFRTMKIPMKEGIVEVSVTGKPLSLYIHHSFQSRTSPSIAYGMTMKHESVLSYILYNADFENTPYKTLNTLKTKKLAKELYDIFGELETLRPLIAESVINPAKIKNLVLEFNRLSNIEK